MSDPFIGEIIIFAGNYAPSGWALCNGQLLQIAQYQALFAILGTTYGGNGQTTFALPDLRGRAPIHAGQGVGLANYPLGQRGGTETVTLNPNEIPAHAHTYTPHAVYGPGSTANPAGAYVAQTIDSTSADPFTNFAPPTASPKVAMALDTTNAAGGSAAHPNLQPYLALNYIIALQGIYPARN